jgi:hypothetical protein
MQWVEGVPLNIYARDHLGARPNIRNLGIV